MKKTTALKALVLSMVMVLGFVMPMAAQTDGFFKNNNEDIYGNRDGGTSVTGSGITNQQFGQTVPVGSGLLIMVAAGAGYAVARRRRSMRKAGTMLLALAMVLTFTQCKKRIEPINPTTSSQGGVHITVRVDNDAKHQINTATGEVTFTNDDMLFVINDNKVVGVLSYSGSAFVGEIGHDMMNPAYEDDPTDPDYNIIYTALDDNDKLHFCFTGNCIPDEDSAGNIVVFIGGQKDKMPVLSCGSTEKTYGEIVAAGDLDNLTCELQNKCALVKFTITNTVDENNNEFTVSADNDVTILNTHPYAKLIIGTDEHGNNYVDMVPSTATGSITLHPEVSNGNERWAVLLPQESATTCGLLIDNLYYNNAVTIDQLNNNDFTASTINCSDITPTAYNFFTVRQGKKVVIAPGNLQYNKDDGYRFAENQWDFVGGNDKDTDENPGTVYVNSVQCSNNLIDENYAGWIDLFGWGTGDNPLKCDADSANYSTFNDWGDYVGGGWYTPNALEWLCLLGYRGNPDLAGLGVYGYDAPIRYNKTSLATVNGVRGIVILPDYFRMPENCTFAAPANVFEPEWLNGAQWCQYTQNVYNDDNGTNNKWSDMEEAGAIFVPAAGKRFWDTTNSKWKYAIDASFDICLWTPDKSDKGNGLCSEFFSPDPIAIVILHMESSYGASVRLFKEFSF